MKKTTLFIVVSVFFILSSCLPSLHSIVNDENRITDDRLVGDWLLIDGFFLADFPIKFETDDAFDLIDGVQTGIDLLKGNGQSFKDFINSNHHYETWKFERAAKLEFEYSKLPEGTVGWSHHMISGEESGLKEVRKQYNSEHIIIKKKEYLPYYILTYKEVGNDPSEIRLKVELTKINGTIYMDMFPIDLEVAPGRFMMNFIGAHTFAKLEFKENRWLMSTFDIDKITELIKTKRIRIKHEVVIMPRQEAQKIVYDENFILTAPTEELRAFLAKYGNEEELYADVEGLIKYDE